MGKMNKATVLVAVLALLTGSIVGITITSRVTSAGSGSSAFQACNATASAPVDDQADGEQADDATVTAPADNQADGEQADDATAPDDHADGEQADDATAPDNQADGEQADDSCN